MILLKIFAASMVCSRHLIDWTIWCLISMVQLDWMPVIPNRGITTLGRTRLDSIGCKLVSYF